MATKPKLTNEAIALTQKKINMTLDDIIKMSKKPVSKGKNPRISNKSRAFIINNGTTQTQGRASNLKRFLNSRSTLRQSVLAQRRTNFKLKNQLPLAAEVASKPARFPVSMRFPISHRSSATMVSVSIGPLNSVYERPLRQTRTGKVFPYPAEVIPPAVLKQGPQTLDSLFANMKEQRLMRARGTAPSGRPVGRQASFGRNGNAGNNRTRPSR